MEENVFNRIEPNGYFAGGFFGKEHCWASNVNLSIMTQEKIKLLFESSGFVIRSVVETKKEINTILNGKQLFHTLAVVAQRTS